MMVLLLAGLIATERPVVVSALTTEQLVRQCAGRDADPTPDFCTGYLMAAFDTLSLSRQICPSSARLSTIDVAAATRRYLRTRGKKSQAAPAFVVRDALRRAYPCGRQ